MRGEGCTSPQLCRTLWATSHGGLPRGTQWDIGVFLSPFGLDLDLQWIGYPTMCISHILWEI